MKGVLQVHKQPCQLFCVWPIHAPCIKRCAFTSRKVPHSYYSKALQKRCTLAYNIQSPTSHTHEAFYTHVDRERSAGKSYAGLPLLMHMLHAELTCAQPSGRTVC